MTRPLLLLFMLALGPALAAPGFLKGDTPELTTPNIVGQARGLAVSDRMEAIAVLEDYLSEGKDVELLPLVTLEAGEQRRLSGDFETASEHFKTITRKWPEHPAKDAALLGMALLAYDSGHASGNSLATLRMIPERLATPTQNADRYRILALEAAKEGASQQETVLLVEQAFSSAEGDPQVSARVHRSLSHLAPEQEQVEEQLADFGSDAADLNTLQRAQSALRAGDTARATELAQALLRDYPESSHVNAASWVVKRAEAGAPYNRQKVGVLLPLSGRLAPPGAQIKATLELAFRGTGAELVFLDTEGNGATAVSQFETLVLKHGVAAVIGPLLQDTAVPVVAEAQAAGVPLVTLSQASDLTQAGEWVFQTALTPEHQVQALLKEMMDGRGLRKFAIMAPNTPYGEAAKSTFVEQVMKKGGSITDVVIYDAKGKDYRKSVRELGPQTFDAIFVPDSHGRVAMVASALAYEEFAIGSFSAGKGVVPVPLIGLNGWHNPDLAKAGGKYVERCVFVDAFYAEDPLLSSFVDLYEGQFGRAPSVMDATTYDTAKLVAVAVASQPADRGAFRAALAGAALSSPVAAGGSFGSDREVLRELYTFTIDDGSMHRIGEPPEIPE